MKITRQLLTIGFALLVSTVLASAIPGRAAVAKVVGQATVAKQGGSAVSITAGMVLGTGDTITTGAGATVDLNLGVNGDVLRVEPDSTLEISQLEVVNVANPVVNTKLNVAKGGVTANVINKLSAASRYEVRTPSGVAGIRGTIYNASVGTGMSVIHGAVSWTPQGGVTVNVFSGQNASAGVRALGAALAATISQSVATSTTASLPTQAANTINTLAQAIATQAANAVKQGGGTDAQAAAAAATAAQQAVTQVVQALKAAYPASPTVANIAAAANQTTIAAAAVGAATGIAANGGSTAAANAAAQQALTTAAQATGATVSTQNTTAILAVAKTAATTTATAVSSGQNAFAAITSTVTTSAANTTQTVTTSPGTGGGAATPVIVSNPLTVSSSGGN